MKRFSILIMTLAAVALIANSCKKSSPDFGTPFSKTEGIADDWELVELKQTDLLTKSDDKTVDLTQLFIGGNPAALNFTSDGSFSGEKGSSRLYFPASGSWAFDDDLYPSKLVVTSNGQEYILDLLSPVRENIDPYLHVQYVRPFEDCVPAGAETLGAIAYEYKFARR